MIQQKELLSEGYIIQFGVPPHRIDLLNFIDGVSFKKAWLGKQVETIAQDGEEIKVYFIGLKELIENKEKSGRNKDLEDLKYLREAYSGE